MDDPGGKLIYPDLSYMICGKCFNVHNALGRYSREKQYSDALENELKKDNISYQREWTIAKTGNRVDFLIDDKIILEIKAIDHQNRLDYYQLQRYLQAANMRLGLLVNFRRQYLRPKRVVRIDTPAKKRFV